MAIKNRKAMYHTLLAIVFLSIFIVVFVAFNQVNYQDRSKLVAARVLSVDRFITDLHKDLDRAAYISGFRSLIALEEHVSDKGTFFSDQDKLETAFIELFLNGTINGSSYEVMTDSTFNHYITSVSSKAQKLDVSLAIDINDVTLSQTNPWYIDVLFDAQFTVADKRGTAQWNYNKSFSTVVPITDVKDPLYTVKTNGRVPITILPFDLPAEGFVADDNSTDVLKEFIDGHYYIANPDAPSYLQRFTGDLSSHPAGIESIVHLPLLSDQGVVVFTDRSVVDHKYFAGGGNSSSDRCSIQGLIFSPNWFRIDEDHDNFYEVDELSYGACP